MGTSRIGQILRHLVSTTAGSSRAASQQSTPTSTAAAGAATESPPALQEDHYFTYDELTEMCQGIASAYPTMCELGSIGTSREGRELWLLTLTDTSTGAAEDKPAYFIYGNIHASEPTGAHCAVYNALHLLKDEQDLLKRVAFYIVPRVTVDGAEYCVTTGGRVRSRMWNESGEHREPNTIYPEDVNSDGWIVDMRIEHPSGEYVADPVEPRLMVPRQRQSVAGARPRTTTGGTRRRRRRRKWEELLARAEALAESREPLLRSGVLGIQDHWRCGVDVTATAAAVGAADLAQLGLRLHNRRGVTHSGQGW